MAAANGLKAEEDVTMKSEIADVPAIGYADDDDEDTGELSLPPSMPTVWLTRVPRFLWQVLASEKEDEEIQIGTVKHWTASDGTQKMALSLKSDRTEHADIPKDYKLNIVNMTSANTFIFSEKDQEGFKPQAWGRSRADRSMNQGPKTDGNKVEKRKRRGIPKHTALAGIAQHELNCQPVDNAEHRELELKRATKNARSTTAIGVGLLERGHDITGRTGFETFIKTGAPTRPAKPQENKAARIPQNELLDMLYRLFKEYKYWRLGDLKAKTNQPETYLKETLAKIAYLVKSGPNANTWTLNQEAQATTYVDVAPKEEVAPDEGEDDLDDDDNLEMEDAM